LPVQMMSWSSQWWILFLQDFTITNVIGTDPTPLISSNQVVVTTPGLYFITTAAGSCTVSNEILVTPASVPDYMLDITADTLTCSTTAATLRWTTDIPNADPTFDGEEPIQQGTEDPQVSIPGWYYITVEDDNNCEFADSVEVILDDEAPLLTLADQQFDCTTLVMDRNLKSTVVGEVVSYAWTGPGFSSDEPEPTVTEPGTYELTVTGDNGCTATEDMEVTFISRQFDFEVDSLLLPCGVDSVLVCAYDFEIPIVAAEWSILTDTGDQVISMDSCFWP